ncbi:hypothetical protein AAFC00_007120 [Neodothiora populina]|uniref:Zn(2)-C6 fungal-type domain-containing protein n=1 Tax=Neodothiora populina TaxID=2781224 RepID=A0ABR3PC96_9PEZI
MSSTSVHGHPRPATIAPAPPKASSANNPSTEGDSPRQLMPFACQACVKRKVRCDKASPICSSCRKGSMECIYRAPPPRRQKRKLSYDVEERLARYEQILGQHGLLPQDPYTPVSIGEKRTEDINVPFMEPETYRLGRLLAGQGKSRYIDSHLWTHLGDDAFQGMSEDEDDEENDNEEHLEVNTSWTFSSDPLTGALMGSRQSLLHCHPTHADAKILWKMHIENVEPICKILHVPSVSPMVSIVSQQPALASKTDESLLFAIYHFAVFSSTEDECLAKFEQSRAFLMQRYHFATRQALVNASFLKTTDMSVLQALVLFLLSCRHSYDPQTYWILTGVAVRISQRMGLHRDGESLGVSPFDVQMRRRLFYQILPLDGVASQMSGTGIGIVPDNDTWDTQPPLNLDDDQISPGMTEMPVEKKGPTEMIFCLARACIGTHVVKAGMYKHGAGQQSSKVHVDFNSVIDQAENEVEERYIRYCDVAHPLHFLTIGFVRSAITAMRLRMRLQKAKDTTVTHEEARELFQLSEKIINTHTATYNHLSLKSFQWLVRPLFAWGSWDSLILVLTSLRRSDLLSRSESDAAWSKVGQVYQSHNELLDPKRALQKAVGRLLLVAWDINPPSHSQPQPSFVTTLRSALRPKSSKQSEAHGSSVTASTVEEQDTSQSLLTHEVSSTGSSDFIPYDMGMDTYDNFNTEKVDWQFWDQLIKDYQTRGS